MILGRQQCGVAVLNRQIYVAGGKTGTGNQEFVDRFTVETGQWEEITEMTSKRRGLELVALNGFLYAIGGHDGKSALNTVERYDPEVDEWTQMASTNYTMILSSIRQCSSEWLNLHCKE